jgi:glycosyltransferase involved in cell wall biosynthesis
MLVSVIIPAHQAVATIGQTVASLLAQTYRCWEAIIVADEAQDYAAILADIGIADLRLRFVSTGAVRSSCHNACNVGLAAARGEIIAQLDADDRYDAHRLEALAPLAASHGAVVDQVGVVSDTTGQMLYRAPCGLTTWLSAQTLLDLGAPLSPVLHRRFADLRLTGVEYAEDVIANLRLLERVGPIPVFPQALYHYRVVDGSLSHSDNSGAYFDTAYSAYLGRLRNGDGLGLVRNRAAALTGFARKRAVNRLFIAARQRQPHLSFQDFMASYRGSVSRALETLAEPGSSIRAAGIAHS